MFYQLTHAYKRTAGRSQWKYLKLFRRCRQISITSQWRWMHTMARRHSAKLPRQMGIRRNWQPLKTHRRIVLWCKWCQRRHICLPAHWFHISTCKQTNDENERDTHGDRSIFFGVCLSPAPMRERAIFSNGENIRVTSNFYAQMHMFIHACMRIQTAKAAGKKISEKPKPFWRKC